MRRLELIDLGWNDWNGFTFSILWIETMKFEGGLLGIAIAYKYFAIDLLFHRFEIRTPFN